MALCLLWTSWILTRSYADAFYLPNRLSQRRCSFPTAISPLRERPSRTWREDEDEEEDMEEPPYRSQFVRERDLNQEGPRRPFRDYYEEAPLDRPRQPVDDYFDDDDEEEEYDDEVYERRPRPLYDRYDEEEEEEAEDDKDGSMAGNFWSNPQASLDWQAAASKRRTPNRRPSSRDRPTTTDSRRRPRRPTTFRSGTPEPPAPVLDLYDRLFWYGMDDTNGGASSDDNDSDRTMFGGTRGKFNGLAFFDESKGRIPDNRRTRRRPRARSEAYDDDENDWVDEDDQEDEIPRASSYRSVTPPYDPPQPRTRQTPPVQASSNSSPRKRQRRRGQDPSERDWVSREVSNWFQDAEMEEDEQDEEGDDDFERSGRRRRRGRRQPASDDDGWTPFRVLNVFLGVDREALESQANDYDRRMGLGGGSSDRQDGPSRRRQRRQGRAYRYPTMDDDEETPPFADDKDVIDTEADIVVEEEDQQISSQRNKEIQDSSRRRELTWEERALAVERVPPSDIPAWGPTGDLGMDARTKAINDALEDISEAQRRLKVKEKREALAKEEIGILKVDAELERKRLFNSRLDRRTLNEKLRRMDREVDDAARAYRYAQLQVQGLREELQDLQARHWGVLSFYDPNKANQVVSEALRELEQTEPAVRRIFRTQKAIMNEADDSIGGPSSDNNSNPT